MAKFRNTLVALTALVLAGPASAQPFSCSVNPSAYLGMNGGGLVTVAINGGTIQAICSLSQTTGGVTAEACTAWYSTLLTWRTSNRSGNIYFDPTNSANAGFTSCSQFQSWDMHFPYHIDGA